MLSKVFLSCYSNLSFSDIHLPPKIGVSHLHIFKEGVFCRKTIKKVQTQKQAVEKTFPTA
ncbi:hypothetical protein D0U04_26690 [Bacillus clarus]|uniref:Fibronectin n=1 Tax=Bacillus clarus TaxID=2338372 RepID=A0ABX9KND5_9BACI|nr:hypothetical protein D0U04_26690 [Bacillus clarus]